MLCLSKILLLHIMGFPDGSVGKESTVQGVTESDMTEATEHKHALTLQVTGKNYNRHI